MLVNINDKIIQPFSDFEFICKKYIICMIVCIIANKIKILIIFFFLKNNIFLYKTIILEKIVKIIDNVKPIK